MDSLRRIPLRLNWVGLSSRRLRLSIDSGRPGEVDLPGNSAASRQVVVAVVGSSVAAARVVLDTWAAVVGTTAVVVGLSTLVVGTVVAGVLSTAITVVVSTAVAVDQQADPMQ